MVPAMYVKTDSKHNTAKPWNQKLYIDTDLKNPKGLFNNLNYNKLWESSATF